MDIGAYEFTTGDPSPCVGGLCLGDLNMDGQINGGDVQMFVNILLGGQGCVQF